MKRLLTTCLMMTLIAVCADAQANLNISVFFDANSSYADDAKEVWVEGSQLRPYRLSLYRSITTENKQTITAMEQAVIKDGKKAADKEIGYIGSRLYYAFLSMKPATSGSTVRRYVFYRNASLKSSTKKDATLVYMEGQITMEELKNLFK